MFSFVKVDWILSCVCGSPEKYRNVDSLGDDFWIFFRIPYFGWFDSGYMFMPVYGGVWTISQIFLCEGGHEIQQSPVRCLCRL